jgi:predicted nucleic acid-binding protein
VTVVLDADVVIGALDASDAHHDDSRERFALWHQAGTSRVISLVNLTEVLTAPAGDPARLRTARAAIAALGISIHVPSEAIAVDAARLRSRYPISLPDAYAVATARHIESQLVTFDRKLARVAGQEGIR